MTLRVADEDYFWSASYSLVVCTRFDIFVFVNYPEIFYGHSFNIISFTETLGHFLCSRGNIRELPTAIYIRCQKQQSSHKLPHFRHSYNRYMGNEVQKLVNPHCHKNTLPFLMTSILIWKFWYSQDLNQNVIFNFTGCRPNNTLFRIGNIQTNITQAPLSF